MENYRLNRHLKQIICFKTLKLAVSQKNEAMDFTTPSRGLLSISGDPDLFTPPRLWMW